MNKFKIGQAIRSRYGKGDATVKGTRRRFGHEPEVLVAFEDGSEGWHYEDRFDPAPKPVYPFKAGDEVVCKDARYCGLTEGKRYYVLGCRLNDDTRHPDGSVCSSYQVLVTTDEGLVKYRLAVRFCAPDEYAPKSTYTDREFEILRGDLRAANARAERAEASLRKAEADTAELRKCNERQVTMAESANARAEKSEKLASAAMQESSDSKLRAARAENYVKMFRGYADSTKRAILAESRCAELDRGYKDMVDQRNHWHEKHEQLKAKLREFAGLLK